jgi:hypothetical protein
LCRFTLVYDPFELPNRPEAIQLNDSRDRAYIALEESGLDIDDVSDRDNPTLIANHS